MVWDIIDTQDNWDNMKDAVNKAIMDKAMQLGITRCKNYNLCSFDIKDMYEVSHG